MRNSTLNIADAVSQTGATALICDHLIAEGIPDSPNATPIRIRPVCWEHIRGADYGIWRRVNLVPFTEQIGEDEVDPDLEQKLIAEAPGILQWILTGIEDWFAVGLDLCGQAERKGSPVQHDG